MKRQRYAALVLPGILLILTLLPVLSVQAEFGNNWTAQFFNTVDLDASGGAVVAVAGFPAGINSNWGAGQPTDGSGTLLTTVNADNFSARFTSTQVFSDGVYDFTIAADDGARLFVDGVLVFDAFATGGLTTDTVQRTMTAGNHTLVVEYLEVTGNAVIQVQWFLSGTGGVPGITPTPAPVTTGSVHTVKGLAVRTGPYLGASMVAIARPDTAYPVSARNHDEGIYTWYLITVGEKVGWSSGRYFTVTGPEPPEQTTVFDTIDGAPGLGVLAIPRAVMNFRPRPTIRRQRIGWIPWGAETELLGRTVQGGMNFWFHVRYNGVVGWIYAPYITVHGDVNRVPIR